jgi:hypothetical protein
MTGVTVHGRRVVVVDILDLDMGVSQAASSISIFAAC